MGIHGQDGTYHAFRSHIPLSILSFRETDANGDVGNLVAHGGILASDSSPVLRGAAGLISQELSWIASNSDPVVCQAMLPADFDGREDVLVELWVSSGTTDPATFTVATSWDAGATVSDTATDSDKSATMHKITAVISRADVPDSASFVTILLTPGAHTTNAIQLHACRLGYLARSVS